MVVDVIHIHEDAWGMRNLYPASVRDEVDEDLYKAAMAEEKNRAPSGIGYTDIYVAKSPSENYSTHALSLEAVGIALNPIFPRVREFNATTYSAMVGTERDAFGSYETDAWCFGIGADCFVKIDANGDFVKDIWFDLTTDDPDTAILLRKAIIEIDKLVPSIIADYYLNFLGSASQGSELDRYFDTLAEQHLQSKRAYLEYQERQIQTATAPGFFRKLASRFGLLR